MDDLKIGDRLKAKDGSCTFVIEEFTRVGANGTMTLPDGRTLPGSATHAQLDNDFTKEEGTHG